MSSECQLSILQDFLQLFIPEYCLRVVSNVYSFQNMKFIKNNRNAILAPPFSEWQETKKIEGSRKKTFVKSLTFSREVLYFLHFFWIEQIEILIAVKILVVDTWQQFVIWHYFFFSWKCFRRIIFYFRCTKLTFKHNLSLSIKCLFLELVFLISKFLEKLGMFFNWCRMNSRKKRVSSNANWKFVFFTQKKGIHNFFCENVINFCERQKWIQNI